MSLLVGTNCYFLQEEGARGALGWTGYADRVDQALDTVARLGLGLVRAWAFHDDPDNPATLQVAPLTYLPTGFAGIDRALFRARQLGLRLVLSLGNHWGDYGGIPQYLRWHGLADDQPWRFFTEPALRAHYRQHLANVLAHRNPLTGLTWGEDDTVLAWELLNEPRGAGLPSPTAFLDWVAEMADTVRGNARQWVCTGEEGLGDDGGGAWAEAGGGWMHRDTGQDFAASAALVDVASVHLYPEHWGWRGDLAALGSAFIADRAARTDRPLLLGEFGLDNHGLPLAERRRILDAWVNTARACGLLGVASWSFSTDDRPDDWDAFTWRWRTGTPVTHVDNRLADLHARWARA